MYERRGFIRLAIEPFLISSLVTLLTLKLVVNFLPFPSALWPFDLFTSTNNRDKGSGCVSVGRAVASDIRGPWFKSSHRQKFIYIEHLFTVNCVLKRQK